MPSVALPVMPLGVSKEEAIETASDELDSNGWGEAELGKPVLELVPFYFFHFDAYIESISEETKSNAVTNVHNGTGCLNSLKNELDDVCSELINPELIQQSFEIGEKQEVKTRSPLFDESEIKEAVRIKIAAKENVPKNNVHLAGVKLVYVPFWVFSVQLNEEKLELRINGLSGSFDSHDESPVPYRERTKRELLSETIGDLRSPKNWFSYAGGLLKSFFSMLNPNKPHPDRWMLIFILVLIVLFLIGMGFIDLPTPA